MSWRQLKAAQQATGRGISRRYQERLTMHAERRTRNRICVFFSALDASVFQSTKHCHGIAFDWNSCFLYGQAYSLPGMFTNILLSSDMGRPSKEGLHAVAATLRDILTPRNFFSEVSSNKPNDGTRRTWHVKNKHFEKSNMIDMRTAKMWNGKDYRLSLMTNANKKVTSQKPEAVSSCARRHSSKPM